MMVSCEVMTSPGVPLNLEEKRGMVSFWSDPGSKIFKMCPMCTKSEIQPNCPLNFTILIFFMSPYIV